jgi:hypothetical protein
MVGLYVAQLFEREARREKVIEAKNRELRLKMKTRQESEVAETSVKRAIGDLKDPVIIQCEKDYQTIIDAVNNCFPNLPMPPPPTMAAATTLRNLNFQELARQAMLEKEEASAAAEKD